MIYKLSFYGLLTIQATTLLTGCTNVGVWDRNILAKDTMTTIPDPLGVALDNEIEFAREGTEGAKGLNAGGCGCN